MTKIREFRATDLIALELQDAQRGVLGIHEPDISLAHGFQLKAAGPAYTAEDRTGRVVACAGMAECFQDVQATAWALFAKGWWHAINRRMVISALRDGLAAAPYARIEALAREARPGECRLLEVVGFRRVAALALWGPRSETVILHEKLGPVPKAAQDPGEEITS